MDQRALLKPFPIIFSSFTAINVTGERLSHAVGYAFKACLAKKKEIEKANQTLSQESNFPYKEKSVDVQSPGKCDSIASYLGLPREKRKFPESNRYNIFD